MPWKQVTIERPYTEDALYELLREGAKGSASRYTHFDIVEWAGRYAQELSKQHPIPENLFRYWQVTDDMQVRWELHIASHYSINDMKRFSHVDILLPRQFFQQWLKLIDL